jgi:septal ring factor EnvC (AmiA/AmiB activator)
VSNIKTWQELFDKRPLSHQTQHIADMLKQAEITDLRTALAERDAECGRLRHENAAHAEHMARKLAERDAEIERLRGIVPEVLENLNDQICEENATLRAAAQQALAALGYTADPDSPHYDDQLNAITALTAALKGTP